MTDGFSQQRGAIFGFGPKSHESTGTLLKISDVSDAKRRKLNKVQVANLNEEHRVTVNTNNGIHRLSNYLQEICILTFINVFIVCAVRFQVGSAFGHALFYCITLKL